MNIHQYIQTLRLHLLDMARVCQRGVDYSIKAYSLGSPECCTNVRDDAYEINILHREIEEITREILLVEISEESDLRFVLSAERILMPSLLAQKQVKICLRATTEISSDVSMNLPVTLYRQHRRKQMKQFRYLAELVDPRSHDGGRFSYQGMTFLPVSYECEWMTSSEDLQRVVATEIRNFVNHVNTWD